MKQENIIFLKLNPLFTHTDFFRVFNKNIFYFAPFYSLLY
jgi:hypothetical protein